MNNIIKEMVEQAFIEALGESTTDHAAMAAKHAAHEHGHANEADRQYNNRSDEDDRSHEDHSDAAIDHGDAHGAHKDAHAALKKHGADSSQYKKAADKAHASTKTAKESSSYTGKISSRFAPGKEHKL